MKSKDSYAVLLAVVVSLALTLFGCATTPVPTVAEVQHGSLNDFKGLVINVQERDCGGEGRSYVGVSLIDSRLVLLGENDKMVMSEEIANVGWITFGVWNSQTGAFTLDLSTRHRYTPGMNACADLFGGDTKLKPSGHVPRTGPGFKNSI